MKMIRVLKVNPHFILAFIVFLVAMLIDGYYEVQLIKNSSSSTAAIGYIFLPLTVFIVSLPWLGVGISLSYVVKAMKTRAKKDAVLAVIGIIFSAIYIIYTAIEYQKKLDLIDVVAQITLMDAERLDSFVKNARYRNNKFALGAVSQNEKTGSNTLAHIAELDDLALHEAMWSDPLIMGNNKKGLAVMRLVESHPNVTPDILRMLSKSPVSYVKGDVAGNTRTPVDVLKRLYYENKNSEDFYLIEWGLSYNAFTPIPILEALANSKNEYTLNYLKTNPSTPANIISVLKGSNEH